MEILIFKGDDELCYGIMRVYSDKLNEALCLLGESVIYANVNDRISEYIGKEYKAIIAFMETVFYIRDPMTGEFIFDSFIGPKFNYWPDYPTVFYKQISAGTPKDYFILTHDGGYAEFINRYYTGVRAYRWFPGGTDVDEIRRKPMKERKLGISFIGTYIDSSETLKQLDMIDPMTRAVVENYTDILVNAPELSQHEAFSIALQKMGVVTDDKGFVDALSQAIVIVYGIVAPLFRERVIAEIVNNGIDIDVFGDSWKKSPFVGNPHFFVHDSIRATEVMDIYCNSKICLNVMSWHRDSITERVLDPMLAGSISMSDETKALKEAFCTDGDENNAELILFSLRNIADIPRLITEHLNDENMACRGYIKAKKYHTWLERAKELLCIIEQTKGCNLE